MRPLIVTAFVSVDGVMEAPGGEPGYRNTGWTMNSVEMDPAAYEIKAREQEEATALLLGRRSYEAFAPVWPTMVEEFAGYNAMPRYVVSTTLTQDDSRWPATILRSVDDVADLKQEGEGPISVHGSATLGKALADAGLVDRYHLLVFPVLLGAGKRLFSDTDKDARKLKLVEHEAYSNGVQKQVFDVVQG
ncbi:dihydrofolate reductase family protein [Nocardiopsis sp. ATB16-24]|uniref:dihydrofolate reductase family protein n=1 Tax=Nocardiopsis sp. ATB16-24 TaxID=3019555 RepID=UPI0025578EE0|nr:dihydrofolate reductase family protein [Nocardiopsis sp. ATB16-24]